MAVLAEIQLDLNALAWPAAVMVGALVVVVALRGFRVRVDVHRHDDHEPPV